MRRVVGPAVAFWLLLVAIVLYVYLAWTPYEDLPCQDRFALEVWYSEHHPGDEMSGATFTFDQLLLPMEEVCQ